MKAIITRYVPATDTKGDRIIASAEGARSVSVPYRHDLVQWEAHVVAAIELARRLGVTETLQAGGTKTGYVFVPINENQQVNPAEEL